MPLNHRLCLPSEAAKAPPHTHTQAEVLGIHLPLQARGVALQKAPEPQPTVGVRWVQPTLCPGPAHVGALSWSEPAEAPHLREGRMHQPGLCLGGQVARESIVGTEHLQGMGAGKLDQATGGAALSPDCTLESPGSFEKIPVPRIHPRPIAAVSGGGTQATVIFQFLQVISSQGRELRM